VLGGTINDVVLTVVAGAVTRYVQAHREPVEGRFVRLMVPVNLRTENPQGSVGNEISMLPLTLPLDIADPAERLKEIARRSAAMKAARVADVVQLIGTGLGWTPPTLQQTLAGLPFLPQTSPALIVNMVCTNVPGPMVPLYSNGRELLTYYPHVPCGSNVGISVAISSYNQKLFYGVTYDGEAAPDGELFRDFITESYDELRDTAGVRPAASASRSATTARAPASTGSAGPSGVSEPPAARDEPDTAATTSGAPPSVTAPVPSSTDGEPAGAESPTGGLGTPDTPDASESASAAPVETAPAFAAPVHGDTAGSVQTGEASDSGETASGAVHEVHSRTEPMPVADIAADQPPATAIEELTPPAAGPGQARKQKSPTRGRSKQRKHRAGSKQGAAAPN
jgi:hypothetical protein